jgi:hypothetical protein
MAKDGDGDGSKCSKDTNSASRKLSKQTSNYTPIYASDDNTNELHDEVVEAPLGRLVNKPSKRSFF